MISSRKKLSLGLILILGLVLTGCFSNLSGSDHYIINTEVNNGKGQVALSPHQDTYKEGTKVKVEAVPAEEYEFTSWGGGLSGGSNPQTITVDSQMEIIANFNLKISSYSNDYLGFDYPSNWAVTSEQLNPQDINITVNNDRGTKKMSIDYSSVSDGTSSEYYSSKEEFYTAVKENYSSSNLPDYVTVHSREKITFNGCSAYRVVITIKNVPEISFDYTIKGVEINFYKNNMKNLIYYQAKKEEYDSYSIEKVLDSFYFK